MRRPRRETLQRLLQRGTKKSRLVPDAGYGYGYGFELGLEFYMVLPYLATSSVAPAPCSARQSIHR